MPLSPYLFAANCRRHRVLLPTNVRRAELLYKLSFGEMPRRRITKRAARQECASIRRRPRQHAHGSDIMMSDASPPTRIIPASRWCLIPVM